MATWLQVMSGIAIPIIVGLCLAAVNGIFSVVGGIAAMNEKIDAHGIRLDIFVKENQVDHDRFQNGLAQMSDKLDQHAAEELRHLRSVARAT